MKKRKGQIPSIDRAFDHWRRMISFMTPPIWQLTCLFTCFHCRHPRRRPPPDSSPDSSSKNPRNDTHGREDLRAPQPLRWRLSNLEQWPKKGPSTSFHTYTGKFGANPCPKSTGSCRLWKENNAYMHIIVMIVHKWCHSFGQFWSVGLGKHDFAPWILDSWPRTNRWLWFLGHMNVKLIGYCEMPLGFIAR